MRGRSADGSTLVPAFWFDSSIFLMIHEPAGGARTASRMTLPAKGIDISETLARSKLENCPVLDSWTPEFASVPQGVLHQILVMRVFTSLALSLL
jgi:hypothetical protein